MGIEARFETLTGAVVWAEDFGDYADTAAMLAVWSVVDTQSLAIVDLTTDASDTSTGKCLRQQFTGGTPSAYPYHVTISRTVSGLTPGAAYLFSPRSAGLDEVFAAIAYSATLQNFTPVVVANAAGVATIALAPGITSGSPTSTGYFDGLSLTRLSGFGVLLNAGVLMVDGRVVALSRGGWAFDPQIEYDTWEYDGQTEPLAGTDNRRSARPILKGQLIELGSEQLTLVEPLVTLAGATDGDGPSTTATPAAPGTAITAGDLLVDVVAVWPRLAGGFHRVTLPLGLVTKYSVTGQDKTEAVVPIEIQGRASAAGVAPYTHTIVWA